LQFGHGEVNHGFSKLNPASARLDPVAWQSEGSRPRCFCVRNRYRGQASIVVQFGYTWLGRVIANADNCYRTLQPVERTREHVVMNQNKTPPIDVTDFRADSYSPDGKNVIISLATKYSAEPRTYSLPVASLFAFIADLQKLQSSRSAQPIEHATPVSETAAPPAPAKTEIATPTAPTKDPNRINITVPKKWMMRSGLPDHPFVIVVFDPQTDTQAGFALSAASAKEMAAGLVKYADVLANHELSKSKSNLT
jgi:hypothetical protein